LKAAEIDGPVSKLCRSHGMSSAAFLPIVIKCWGMDASLISENKQLQALNARLKWMYADIAMKNELVKKAFAKK
jgi:putative transposase